ncbi:NAD-dependent dehydratase [Halobacteriales archaeon SW_8_68_21]|nr:MAG: NAD-dependent dehydratase [Halobacteriales archaeon SW_8_68_21]
MSTLLVVGGSGFIGRDVCRFAVRDGHEVRSVSRGGRPDVGEEWAEAVSWTSADLFRPNAWRDRLDAGVLTALEAERAGVDGFVFLSAAANPPGVRNAHLTAKRRVEASIADLDLDAVVLRPGPVYGEGQPHLPGVADRVLRFVASAPPLASRLGELRPLAVGTVARAAYRAALDPGERLLDVSDIRDLAD